VPLDSVKPSHIKRFDCRIKVLDAPPPEDLEIINRDFARRPHTAAELYTFEVHLANDRPDRDGERFGIEVLQDFTRTLIGKSFLFNHERDSYGRGRFYRAELRREGEVTWLVGAVYLLRNRQEELIADLEGGIARFVSIGFLADPPMPIHTAGGQLLYREYRSPVEALEGSLVWLGSQFEARVAQAKALSEAGLLACPLLAGGEGACSCGKAASPVEKDLATRWVSERIGEILRLETLIGRHGRPGLKVTEKEQSAARERLTTLPPEELESRYRVLRREFAERFPESGQLTPAEPKTGEESGIGY